MNIKLLRLVTGEDVLTELVEGTDSFTFKNPLIVYIRPSETGIPSVGMSQWVPYAAAKEFVIAQDKVVFVTDPAEDIRKQYDQVYGAGIVIASSMPLNG